MGEEYYAVGNTKILMRNEIVAIFEKAKAKAVIKLFDWLKCIYRENKGIKQQFRLRGHLHSLWVLQMHNKIKGKYFMDKNS